MCIICAKINKKKLSLISMYLSTKSFGNNVLNIVCQTLISVILLIKVPTGNTPKRCDEMSCKGCLQCGCLRGEFFKGFLGFTKIQGSRILQLHTEKIVWFSIQGNHLKLQVHSTQSRIKKQLVVDKHTGYSIKDGRASTELTSSFT